MRKISSMYPGMVMAQCSRVYMRSISLDSTSPFVAAVRKYSDMSNGLPELTRIRYPGVQRGNYAHLQKDDVLAFNRILNENRVITDITDLEGN